MKDKSFVDSNVWIYLFDSDLYKKQIALNLLGQNHIISTQVVTENINVCTKKLKLSQDIVLGHAKNLIQYCQVTLIYPATIELDLQISRKYQYGFYDSLILSAALEKECTVLFSEDLQHGQIIEGKLKIVNPFLMGKM